MLNDDVMDTQQDDSDEGVIMVLTNEPTEFKVRTLELIYQAASYGGIAYMDGKDSETGEIVPLLVGIKQEGEDKFSIWPFAKLFENKDIKQYLVPNGAGGYSEPNRDEPAGESVITDELEEAARQAKGLDKTQIN